MSIVLSRMRSQCPPARRRGRAAVLALALSSMLTAPAWLPAGAGSAVAQTRPEVSIRQAVDAWLQGRAKVDDVRPTPMQNVYEVRIGADLIYTDASGSHAFIDGQLVDLKSNRNLTQARIDELSRIRFEDLPLNLALKQVNGTGRRKIAVFEDANCIYCKKLRKDLVDLKDATIYTFPLAILRADSETKAQKAMCAPDAASAWNALMIQGTVPDNDGKCTTPLAEIGDLGRKLRINGTPTMFFMNGKRVPGGVPADQLIRLVDENSV